MLKCSGNPALAGRRGIAILGVSFCLLTAYYLLPTSSVMAADISYQGQLEGIASGAHTIVFSLYTAETGGKPIWQETHRNVLIKDGVFNVPIKGITATVRNQSHLYLEVKIENGILPRHRIYLPSQGHGGGKVVLGEKDWLQGNLEPSGTATSADVVEDRTFYSGGSWTQKTGTRTDTLAGGQLIKTGQTTSYATGDDGDLEMGLTFSYTSDANTTTDNNTGLMWAKDGNGAGCNNGNQSVWANAVSWANGLDFAGHSDWRLPNVRELQSIADYGTAGPAIDATYFPNTQSGYYWSSTTYHTDILAAWGVEFNAGRVNGFGKTAYYYVRAVRGSH